MSSLNDALSFFGFWRRGLKREFDQGQHSKIGGKDFPAPTELVIVEPNQLVDEFLRHNRHFSQFRADILSQITEEECRLDRLKWENALAENF